jgi:hypothetical protein
MAVEKRANFAWMAADRSSDVDLAYLIGDGRGRRLWGLPCRQFPDRKNLPLSPYWA